VTYIPLNLIVCIQMNTFLSKYHFCRKIWNLETHTFLTICVLSRLEKVLIINYEEEDLFYGKAMSNFKAHNVHYWHESPIKRSFLIGKAIIDLTFPATSKALSPVGMVLNYWRKKICY